YAIDMVLKDQYDLCSEADTVLERTWAAKTWSAVADRLASRLKELPGSKHDDFTSKYRRESLSRWLIEALRKSKGDEEIIPLMEAEAPITSSYERLVDELLAAGRIEDAKRWAMEGIGQTQAKWPGIADGLRRRLRELAEKEKDWPLVAAMKAEDF